MGFTIPYSKNSCGVSRSLSDYLFMLDMLALVPLYTQLHVSYLLPPRADFTLEAVCLSRMCSRIDVLLPNAKSSGRLKTSKYPHKHTPFRAVRAVSLVVEATAIASAIALSADGSIEFPITCARKSKVRYSIALWTATHDRVRRVLLRASAAASALIPLLCILL
jgi:hypothetical protein